jgi:hypothetical protein
MVSIIYASKTGTCRKYAEELSERTGLPCYSLKEAPSEGPVVFIGWLRGRFLVGSNKIDSGRIQAVCIVGLSPEMNATNIAFDNGIKAPAYYLRGEINRSKLNLFDKTIMAVFCALMKLKGLSDSNRELFDATMNGGTFYDSTYLDQIVRFLKK